MPSLSPVGDVLSRGPVPVSQAVKIVDRVCEILGAMHVAGRPHGSIHAGAVRFHHVGGDITVELDQPGSLPPTYTPPEVARGMDGNARSDIYQVGVLLYHIIAGRPPFEGESNDETLRLQIHGTPTSLEEHELQDVPRELDQLVMQMLSKNPNERPKTVEHIRSRIANLELDSTVMGVRLQALKDAAWELGAATPSDDMPEDVPTRISELPEDDETILPNPPVMRPPIDPTEPPSGPQVGVVPEADDGVDPFADTFIRNRADFDLEDAGDTQMTLPPARVAPPQPQVLSENTADSIREPAARPTTPHDLSPAPSRGTPTAVLALIAVGVFIVTLAVILFLAG